MKNTNSLLVAENNWETSLGQAIPGVGGIFYGKDIAKELKQLSWTGLVWFAVTGEIPDEKIVKLWDRVWVVCTNYPDPRIWNNRVASLCGTTKSTASLAVGGATAMSEAEIFGRRVDMRAHNFLLDAHKKISEGKPVSELIKFQLKEFRVIPGYGRPVNPVDERVKPILDYAEELGYANRKYLTLACRLEKEILKTRYKFYLNIGGVLAALSADFGLSSDQHAHLLTTCFSVGMLACYRDSSIKKEGTLFPLRCERISYEGENVRKW